MRPSVDLLKTPSCMICTSSRLGDLGLFCLFKGRRVPWLDSCRLWTPLPSFVSVAPAVINFGRPVFLPAIEPVDFLVEAGRLDSCSASTTATNYHK